jgi:hypothetical protein
MQPAKVCALGKSFTNTHTFSLPLLVLILNTVSHFFCLIFSVSFEKKKRFKAFTFERLW